MTNNGNDKDNSWISALYKIISSDTHKNKHDLNIYSLSILESIRLNFFSSEQKNLKNDIKHEILENLILYAKPKFDILQKIINENKQACESLGYDVIDITAKTTSRTSPNIGSSFAKSIFELGLSFHPFLNTPYIQSSIIKGLTKSAFKNLGFQEEEQNLYFGNDDRSGNLIFLDAYPVDMDKHKNKLFLWPDITNPHYSKDGKTILYEHKVETNPVIYLTIPIGTVFRFLIAGTKDMNYENILTAFFLACNMGFGAKRSIGYGSMDVITVNNIDIKNGEIKE